MEITNFNGYKNRWNIKSETIIKPGLQSVQKALEKLGNPQDKHRVIHVAGTNGKGSTIAFLRAIAKEHGLSYGSFTSPSIVDVHDQVQLNGNNVTFAQMNKAFEKMQQAGLSGMLTDFELLTVAAFLVFEGENLDVIFIEAGMGGRFDSTNVMKKSIAVIPSISIDHTNFLGDTIEVISWHKAGIIKDNCQLIIGPLEEKAKQVFLQEAKDKHASCIEYGKDFFVQNDVYTYNNQQFPNLQPRMLGDHQLANMALAITALMEMDVNLNGRDLQRAVKHAAMPGRMELIGDNVYLEGAHNGASIDALVNLISSKFPQKRIHFVVGILRDKDYIYMLRKLEQVGASFEFVNFHHERALPALQLYNNCVHSVKCITKDLNNLKLMNNPTIDMTIVVGSLYLISELKEKIGNK